jgi:hypothetical protein
LVAGDTNNAPDIFVYDRKTGQTVRATIDSAGSEAAPGTFSHSAAISPDGGWVAFSSDATNLVLRDHNKADDVFVRDLGLVCPPIALYCSNKPNSAGCKPKITASGTPSRSGETAFFVLGTRFVNNQTGLFFWGGQPKNVPFMGGALCVKGPLTRTPVQSSGGTPNGVNCTGTFSFAFDSAYMAKKGLSAGMTIYGQYWSRDHAPLRVGLSDGIQFTICP